MRLEMYFLATDTPDDKKVSTMITLLPSRIYALLKDIVSPDKPKDKTFDELVLALKKQLDPPPLTIADRFRFHRRHHRCIICQRFKSKPATTMFAPLPEERVRMSPVFETTGVDLAGPMVLRNSEKDQTEYRVEDLDQNDLESLRSRAKHLHLNEQHHAEDAALRDTF
ncbi:hypothetical protein JTE90_019312 [Oedothorax gibbosus]|uniref:Uncharacterized protein n=1 Tax=Oedothorax gibbosus TaxID=931172 RepID=A0AAV6TN54_9ARAC|nr:hypothetical protein JTE90_019312 [Oedothorax gibbosus]